MPELGLVIQPPLELRSVVTPPPEIKTTLVIGQGPAGPSGAGGDKHYEHQQASSSSTWVITHGLNKYPSIICFDSSHDEIEGSVTYQGANQLTVTFRSPTGGYAYLN